MKLEEKLHSVRVSCDDKDSLKLAEKYFNGEMAYLVIHQFRFDDHIRKYESSYYEPMTSENFQVKYFQHFKAYLDNNRGELSD